MSVSAATPTRTYTQHRPACSRKEPTRCEVGAHEWECTTALAAVTSLATSARWRATLRYSKHAGCDIDGERQDGGVEGERQQRLQQNEALHRLCRDADIGRLRGHRDGEREVQEVAVVRVETLVGTGELQAAAMRCAVTSAGIVQGKNRRQEQP